MEKNTRRAALISAVAVAALYLAVILFFLGFLLHIFVGLAKSESELPKEAVFSLVEENHDLLTEAVEELEALMEGLDYGYVSATKKKPVPREAGGISGLYRFDQKNRYRPLENEVLGRALALDGVLEIAYHTGQAPFGEDTGGDIVEYYCGGTGILDSTTYAGFYFSPEDVPCNLMSREGPLEELAPGQYEWREEKLSSESITNRYETARILPHWYYYKKHYF